MAAEYPSNVLIVGNGAREHALGFAADKSPFVDKLYFAAGNPGTGMIGTNLEIGPNDIDRLVNFSKDNNICLVLVGPEEPLTKGLINAFQEAGILAFGPTQKASVLEASKSWASDFMNRHGIPHPHSQSFNGEKDSHALEKMIDYIRSGQFSLPPVIKTDGLAAGKGVVLPETLDEAVKVASLMMRENPYGDKSHTVLIQERLQGYEVSAIGISDGTRILPLLSSQDHKRLLDGDRGPNTGGMGAYAPVPMVDGEMQARIHREILQPTIDGMREEGIPFEGVLYAGLMIGETGPKVIEYNCRFGDPETEALMMLLKSDLVVLAKQAAEKKLHAKKIDFHRGTAIAVVVAAEGYPGLPVKGNLISQLGYSKEIAVFHAGSAIKEGELVTNGGRVLTIAARGKNLASAQEKVYRHITEKNGYFDGAQYRKDIGGPWTQIANNLS